MPKQNRWRLESTAGSGNGQKVVDVWEATSTMYTLQTCQKLISYSFLKGVEQKTHKGIRVQNRESLSMFVLASLAVEICHAIHAGSLPTALIIVLVSHTLLPPSRSSESPIITFVDPTTIDIVCSPVLPCPRFDFRPFGSPCLCPKFCFRSLPGIGAV